MSAGNMLDASSAEKLYNSMVSIDPAHQKWAQDVSANYIKDHMREMSFADKLLPPDTLTPNSPEMVRTPYNDQLTALIEVDTTSVGAMEIGLRDTPDAIAAKGRRVPMGFFTLSTPQIEFDERSLLTYKMSLTRMYEDAALKSLHEAKDRALLIYLAGAADAMQDYANAGAVSHTGTAARNRTVIEVSKFKGHNALSRSATDFVTVPLNRRDFITAQQVMLGRVNRSGSTRVARMGGLKVAMVLINEVDHLELSKTTIDETGSALQGQIYKEGYNDNILAGLRYIRTIKSHILRPGVIFFITEKEYLGRSYTYMDMKFWLEKRPNFVSWMAWIDIGMLIVNIASVVVCELFTGSTTPGEQTSGYEDKQPVRLENLSGLNNKVLDGLYTPNIQII